MEYRFKNFGESKQNLGVLRIVVRPVLDVEHPADNVLRTIVMYGHIN